jgi:hypothetical protein
MADRKNIAKELYTAYCIAVGGVAVNGDPLPTWETFSSDPLKGKQVNAWLSSADRAIELLQDNDPRDHIIKMVNMCPGGDVTGYRYFILDAEDSRKLLESSRSGEIAYSDITLIGIAEPLCQQMERVIEGTASKGSPQKFRTE